MKKQHSLFNLPSGFIINGCRCGIKNAGKDLAIFYSIKDCVSAGVFTKNNLKSNSILMSMKNLKLAGEKIRLIIVNSGCANTANSDYDLKLTEQICKYIASKFSIKKEQILVASTGIIGTPLPIDKIKKGIDVLSRYIKNNETDVKSAIESMMTTDKKIKFYSSTFKIDDNVVRIFGCAKGAGMIYPNMCTMLCFIISDINISRDMLNKALNFSVVQSFNKITIDGETSPNDCVFILCNGTSKNRIIDNPDRRYKKFEEALLNLCLDLAKKIINDAEGATKFIQINVKKAPSKKIAEKISKSVANSLLSKIAIYGKNPNFGRILSACGNIDEKINITKINILVNKNIVIKNGTLLCDNITKEILEPHEIIIDIDLNQGTFDDVYYTSDITDEYIKINSAYFT